MCSFIVIILTYFEPKPLYMVYYKSVNVYWLSKNNTCGVS